METSFLFKVSHELTVSYIFQAQEVILDIQDAVLTDKQSQVNFDNFHWLKVVFWRITWKLHFCSKLVVN